jgi:hypothetical protein
MTNKFAIQTGGMMLVWRNPADTFRKAFLALDPSCSPDPHSGIVIISEGAELPGVTFMVDNLRSELPTLLLQYPQTVVTFWWKESDAAERSKLYESLTGSPMYADHLNFFPSR